MHGIKLSPDFVKVMEENGVSMAFKDGELVVHSFKDYGESEKPSVEPPEDPEEIQDESEDTDKAPENYGVRLNRPIYGPLLPNEDLEAIREFAVRKGLMRVAVIGDTTGEVCLAVSNENPVVNVFAFGLSDNSADLPNTFLLRMKGDPIEQAEFMEPQELDAVVVMYEDDRAYIEKNRAAEMVWKRHIKNGGHLIRVFDNPSYAVTNGLKKICNAAYSEEIDVTA